MARIIFQGNEQIDEIISELKKAGHATSAEAIRSALIFTYENKFKKKIEHLQAKGARKENFCELLGGTIEDGKCHYFVYEKQNAKLVEKFEAIVPIGQLTKKHVEDQYKPSREECEQIIKLQDN